MGLATCDMHGDCVVVYDRWSNRCPMCELQDELNEANSRITVFEDDEREYRDTISGLEGRVAELEQSNEILRDQLPIV